MNKQKKRAVGRDVGTARNEFERERERERGDGKGLWRSSVVFLALLLHRQHQRGRGEGRQLSTSFRFQQLSLGLHHAGRVWGELQEGDGVGRCFIGLMGVVNYKFFSLFFLKDYKFFFFESQNYWL